MTRIALCSWALAIFAWARQRDEVAKEVERLLLAYPLHPVLTSMQGVGIRTAARLLIDVASRAFAYAGHLAAYAGHTPGRDDLVLRSAANIRLDKETSSSTRDVPAALRDPISRAYYARKISRGKRQPIAGNKTFQGGG